MTSLRRQSPARLRAVIARGAAVAACGTLAAACGSTVAPASNTASAPPAQAGTQSSSPSPTATSGGGAGSGTSTTGTSSAGHADINITVSGAGQHWTLRCEPPSGNVPDPQAACERLLGQPALFSTSPHHIMCPQIMGDGPGYIVSGTFLGQHISKAIMDGGCDIGKWSLLHNIFQ